MRSNEALIAGIRRRRTLYRQRKRMRGLIATGIGLSALLATSLVLAPGVHGNATQPTRRYLGATILGPEAGGYVIVALLAFALGVVTALLSYQRKKAKQFKETNRDGEDTPV